MGQKYELDRIIRFNGTELIFFEVTCRTNSNWWSLNAAEVKLMELKWTKLLEEYIKNAPASMKSVKPTVNFMWP